MLLDKKKIGFIISNPKDIDFFLGIILKLDINKFDIIYNDFRSVWTSKFLKDYKKKYKNFTFKSLSNAYFFSLKYKAILSTGDTPYLNFLNLLFIKINMSKFYRIFDILYYKLDFQFRKFLKIKKKVRKNFKLIDYKLSKTRFLFPRGYDLKSNHPGIARLQTFNFFLCHGPVHEQIISNQTSKKIYNIGYPRYDFLIDKNYKLDDLKDEFNIKNNKKTIFWLPAYRSNKVKNPSLPKEMQDRDYGLNFWLNKVEEISSKYNIIVRPHPDRGEKQSKLEEKLKNLGLYVDLNTTRSLASIYKVVDYIFCEISGPFFSAIYNQNKILVLDHALRKDLHPKMSNILDKYSNYYKVDKFLLDTKKVSLSYYLEDEKFWDSQKIKTNNLFNELYKKDSKYNLNDFLKIN